MALNITGNEYREASVTARSTRYVLTVKTWKRGTVTLEIDPWSLSSLGDAITRALKQHADEAARMLARHAKDTADIANGVQS